MSGGNAWRVAACSDTGQQALLELRLREGQHWRGEGAWTAGISLEAPLALGVADAALGEDELGLQGVEIRSPSAGKGEELTAAAALLRSAR